MLLILKLLLGVAALFAHHEPAQAPNSSITPVEEPPAAGAPPIPDAFKRLAFCESGGRPDTNTGTGFYGMYQFNRLTWRGAITRAGLPEWAGRLPSEAPATIQTAAARQLQAERGWQPWPACSRKLGLR